VIEASDFVDPARDLGFAWYAGVPCSYFTPLINHVIDSAGLEYVSAANEGDAVAAACGAAIGGRRAVAMMQNSGLGNAVNPLTSLAWPFRLPLLLVVTWRGDPALEDEPQHRLMGAITPQLLDAMGIPWEGFPEDAAGVEPALERAARHMDAECRPYALLMRRGAVAERSLESNQRPLAPGTMTREVEAGGEPQFRRRDALARIVATTELKDTVVIATTGYTGRELFAIDDRPNHLYMVGSMGCAPALALGLALTRPKLRVVVVDGDGAALMRLGNLATVAAYATPNLVHLLLDNGRHESTGGQATVSDGVDFADIAAACGYEAVFAGTRLETLDAALRTRAHAGPVFAHLRIRPGTASALPRPALAPDAVGKRLMAHIGSAA